MKKGFTLIEIILVAAALALGVLFFFSQKTTLDALARDEQRKIAINAMYFSLEEGYYADHGYYPETIGPDNLTTLDPNLFTDPIGFLLGEEGSDYTYTSTNCTDSKCKSYTLKATLEKEADFVRKSRN